MLLEIAFNMFVARLNVLWNNQARTTKNRCSCCNNHFQNYLEPQTCCSTSTPIILTSPPRPTQKCSKLNDGRISLPASASCLFRCACTTQLRTQVIQALRGKAVDGGEAKEDEPLSTWEHARAALVLRTEAVSVALRWVAGAKTIQVGARQ